MLFYDLAPKNAVMIITGKKMFCGQTLAILGGDEWKRLSPEGFLGKILFRSRQPRRVADGFNASEGSQKP
jgi:hypothetical protein